MTTRLWDWSVATIPVKALGDALFGKRQATISGLAARLRHCASPGDCVEAFVQAELAGVAGLIPGAEAAILAACTMLRKQGLELEPNIAGRSATAQMIDGMAAGAAAIRFGSRDTDFLASIREADAAQARHDHAAAEYGYWKALLYYPAHPVYLVQYAHALKDQGKYPDALVYYLESFFHGGPKRAFGVHAAFCAERIGKADQLARVFQRGPVSAPLDAGDALPSFRALRPIGRAWLGAQVDIDRMLDIMLGCSSVLEAVRYLTATPEFVANNRNLLRLVALAEQA